MKMCPSRRKFLQASCAAVAAKAAGAARPPVEYRRGGMTYRRLGNTGMDVSLLAFGSHTDPADRIPVRPGKTTLTVKGQAKRDRIIAAAFDRGINLLDVYESEGQWEPAARIVKGRRDKVLVSLAHEITPGDIDDACRLFGHVDLYRFHTADIDDKTLENWDLLRRAKEAGKIRAIGIASHIERTMLAALNELEGLDYLFFPYNFIHARADYSQFLPAAIEKNVGLIGMKPLASGSIVQLDPRAPAGRRPGVRETATVADTQPSHSAGRRRGTHAQPEPPSGRDLMHGRDAVRLLEAVPEHGHRRHVRRAVSG